MFGRVMPFEPLGEAARFGGGESRIEPEAALCVLSVLHQLDLFGAGKMHVGQFLEHLRVIDGGVMVSYLDVAPAFQRREHHEKIGHAVASYS